MLHLGVKAHWRDAPTMAALAREVGAPVLEVHLAPRDAAGDRHRVLEAFRPLARAFDLVVHQPFWHEPPGGEAFFVNPGTPDETWRRRSVDALAASADLAHELGARGLVVHPGGVHLPGEWAAGAPEHARRSLLELGEAAAVPLWIENMPWFYGLPEGRLGTSPFGRTPAELEPLVDASDGLCLDVCHAFLADRDRPGIHHAEALVDAFGDRIRHVHVAGAAARPVDPPSGEGVPLTEGDLPVPDLVRLLDRVPAGVVVVPEIRDGFRHGGRRFRDALRTLRAADPGMWSSAGEASSKQS